MYINLSILESSYTGRVYSQYKRIPIEFTGWLSTKVLLVGFQKERMEEMIIGSSAIFLIFFHFVDLYHFWWQRVGLLKFVFFKKATKIDEIFTHTKGLLST